MNRNEVVNYIMENPKHTCEYVKNVYGDRCFNVRVELNVRDELIQHKEGDNMSYPFSVYRNNDKAEFRIRRKLKEMKY